MKCMLCGKETKASPYRHNPLVLCSPECRNIRARQRRVAYSKSGKGEISKAKWISSDRRKKNEYGYRQKPRAKKLAVLRTRKWESKNPDKKKELDREYGYRRRNYNAGIFDRKAWKEKLEILGSRCVKCGSIKRIEIDHIKPLSKGGTNHIDNLQPLCKNCNSQKNNTYEENL